MIASRIVKAMGGTIAGTIVPKNNADGLLDSIIPLHLSVDAYIASVNKYTNNELSDAVDRYQLAANGYLEI